ncbi:quinone oxidoreductase family protein [Paenibacillus turpanensis]|uniref:quinone oxidoreductase family protein n=1 Tax=Paenibacillus turpanensis TaxID=2689078 RepID=UPI00140848CE|nr:zinc-binding dehydrogenase [Paenibacillus turpanensis]
MKAIVVTAFGGSEHMHYTEMEIPAIAPTQVLIRVEATSVNFADIKTRYGKKGAGPLPYIPGLDAAGVIVQVGEQVKGLRVGQRVAAFPVGGSYAEYAAAEEVLTFALPDGIDFETAAACPTVSFTAYKLLADVGRLQGGETVLIHAAAGGVGTTAIQLAKRLGAGKVIGTVGSQSKAAAAIEAGADHVICYEDGQFSEQVNELTGGRGADVILDSISGWVSEQSMLCLAPYGRLVHFGNAGGRAGTILTQDLHASCRSVLGFSLGTTRSQRPQLLQETAEKVFGFLQEGSLKMQIGGRFALKDAAQAHDWVESRQSTGKTLLVP